MSKRVMLTEAMLRTKDACADQLKIFADTWPDGAAVTKRNALKAARLGLDASWVAEGFLPDDLRDEYDRQRKPLLDEYHRQVKPLRDEYERQVKPLWDKYARQRWLVLYPLLRRALDAPSDEGGEG